MRLLLDTHALLWWLEENPALSRAAYAAIADSETVAVSAASIWEISTKQNLGKLRPPVDDVVGSLEASRLETLPITPEHAWAAGALPLNHRDPFDRILVAQAQLEGFTIVTRDPKIAAYQVAVLTA